MANINFDPALSFEQCNTFLRIIEQLSYRQLVILAYIKDKEILDTNKWTEAFFKQGELGIYQDFYSELIDLYNHQLLQQAGQRIAMAVTSLKLSPLGHKFYELLELFHIESEDKAHIKATIFQINHHRIR